MLSSGHLKHTIGETAINNTLIQAEKDNIFGFFMENLAICFVKAYNLLNIILIPCNLFNTTH
jgi:hypothetical protein